VVPRSALAVVLVAGIAPAVGAQQFDRRARDEPEVVVEAGGRVGTADVIRFSADGKFLLAAGDDKVVRVWPYSAAGLDSDPRQTRVLRWRAWRDQLGGIKAVAVSPDGTRVAVGGYGLRISSVALLDRESGDTLALTWPRAAEGVAHFDAVMAVEFHPDGRRVAFGTADGTLWLWEPVKLARPESGRTWNAPVRVGRFTPEASGSPFNFPRALHFPDAHTLVGVSSRGEVLAYDLRAERSDDPAAPLPPPVGRFVIHDGLLPKYPVDKAAWTADGRWLAVSTAGPLVLLRSGDGRRLVKLELPPDHFPRSLAVHPRTGKLAVGVASVHPGVPGRPRFYAEKDDEIWIYDTPTAPKPQPRKVRHRGRAEALAFHPRDDRLAVAGGDADEVTLLDLGDPERPVSVVRGAGRRLYGVNLADNGEVIGVRTDRNPDATDPNDRARGPWVRFNLARFSPTGETNTRWVNVLTTAAGWSVVPDRQSRFVWYAVRNGERLRLQLDPDTDQAPTCFTFVPTPEGRPARLLVGHYYGCSLFELDPARAVADDRRGDRELPRSKLFIGHGAEVNSVVADQAGTWFVTAGSDHTVAAWSLADWPSQRALGAAFVGDARGLFVTAVDVGSPAWEAGLSPGDRIELLAVDGRAVYDRRADRPPLGSAEAAAALLADPRSGTELFFGWVSPGQNDRRATPTRIKQRPLWKWFPAFDDRGRLTDSVIWMWHGSYYFTASAHGDRLVGWHLNSAEVDGTPEFHPLERYKHLFLRPDVIAKLLASRSVAEALKVARGDNPQRPSFREFEPPPVALALPQAEVRGPVLTVTVSVNPHGRNPDLLPQRAELWVNDYRYKVWSGLGARQIREEVAIPAAVFRAGENRITLLTLNPLCGRAEASRTVNNPVAAPAPTLHGFAAGISDYSAHRRAVGTATALADLGLAREDAIGFSRQLLSYRGPGRYFPTGNLTLLLNADASRAGLMAQIARLRATDPRPDDLLVVYLAGHGDLLTEAGTPRPAGPTAPAAPADLPGTRGLPAESGLFVFCCPDYVPQRAAATAVSGEELFEALAGINCRKLVLLDTCHAGGAVRTNVLRRFVPNGQGPTVIAACDQSQSSLADDRLGHGVFTAALLEALGPRFRAADADTDGRLTAAELYDYLAARVPELVSELRPGHTQSPICFPPPGLLPKTPVVRK